MTRNREEILKDIKSLADNEYRDFHSGLCPGTNNILGVRIPILRNYAKKLINENWKVNYLNIGNEYYEEIVLQGMILGLAKMEVDERLGYLEEFIPKINNWAVCDITCSGLKFTKANKERVYKFLQKYLNSDKEFELRFAIVMLLDYYITDDYIDRVLQILDSTKHTEYYYVKMAVAWALSVAYVKYPNKILEYLKQGHNNLDDDTYNKTIQKIIESSRVKKIEKNKLKKMRR